MAFLSPLTRQKVFSTFQQSNFLLSDKNLAPFQNPNEGPALHNRAEDKKIHIAAKKSWLNNFPILLTFDVRLGCMVQQDLRLLKPNFASFFQNVSSH